MKLPGEIRNAIYELVLAHPYSFTHSLRPSTCIRASKLGTPGRAPLFDYYWREPALLRVSKQVRKEAMAFYYGARTFNLYLQAFELPLARGFILSKQYGPQSPRYAFGRLTTHTTAPYELNIVGTNWSDLASWFALAELVRAGADCQLIWRDAGGLSQTRQRGRLMAVAMEVRETNGDAAELKQRFIDWMKDLLDSIKDLDVSQEDQERVRQAIAAMEKDVTGQEIG